MLSRFTLYLTLIATLTTMSFAQLRRGPNAASGTRIGSQTAAVSGQVRGPDNKAIGNARVELHDIRTGGTVAAAYTRPNGSFEIENVPVDTYEVVAIQGIHETRDRIDLTLGDGSVNLQLNTADAAPGSASTISVADMKAPEKARDALRDAQKKFDKGKFDEARKPLAKALDLYPQYAGALTLRGIINLQGGKIEDGRADLEKSAEYDPNSGLTCVALGAMYNMMGRFDDALRMLDRSLALLPGAWQPQFEMARAYLGKGQFEEALKHISRAENLAPKAYPPVYLVKAHALLGLRNYTAAIAQFEQYLAAEPNGPTAIYARQELDKIKSFAGQGPSR